MREAYQNLVAHLGVDAVVLVDGGTDILLRGDEAGLGTPEEDMTSLAAVAMLEDADRLVVSLGFGIDAFHGVCHAHVLENLAALDRDDGYPGALSIPSASPEARAYLDAVAHAQRTTPDRPSIVQGQIAAALRGEFAPGGGRGGPSRTERQSTRTGSSSRPYTMDTWRNESSSAGTASRICGKRRTRAGYAVRSSIRASSAPMQRWMP